MDDALRRLVLKAVRASGRIAHDASDPKAGLAVTWAAQHGDRVDARLVSGDLEWWVVLSVTDSTSDVVAIEQRPGPFAGVEGGVVVVLNGPSSSGKSSVMRAIVDRGADPWIAFDELFFGHLRLGYAIWPEVAPTVRSGFLDGIAALASAGNVVVMTSGGLAAKEVRQVFASSQLVLVGLDCPLEVLQERQQQRTDRWGDLAEESFAAHDGWTYDLRFDTARLDPMQIADGVLAAVIKPPMPA